VLCCRGQDYLQRGMYVSWTNVSRHKFLGR
jgi:hypothetical protein